MKYLFVVLMLWASTVNGEVFTYVALTDTHTMDDASRVRDQMNWINDNKDLKNIKFVTHSGDFISGTVNHLPYLQTAADEIEQIEVPYLTSPGNWDIPNYDQVFGERNSYGFFSAGDMEFLVIGLEYNPSADSLEWADDILSQHQDKMVILFTHSIEGLSNFTSRYTNIFLVTGGHTARGCEIVWSSVGVVNKLTSNYQSDYGVNYGDCFNTQFRMYTIDTESGSIKVESFSSCSGYDRAEDADFELNMYEYLYGSPCSLNINCGGK